MQTLKRNRLDHPFFDLLEKAIKEKAWDKLRHDEPFQKGRFISALKQAHPFIYDAKCSDQAITESSQFAPFEENTRMERVRDIGEELEFIEEFSLPFKTSLYILTNAPDIIVTADDKAYRITQYGYLIEEETPERIMVYSISRRFASRSEMDKWNLDKDMSTLVIDYFRLDLRNPAFKENSLGESLPENAEETLLIHRLSNMVSVKRIGIEHNAGRSMIDKGSASGFTVIKYDNIYHISDKVPYDYRGASENGEINWEYRGFWRGHWRAFYVKDSADRTVKDAKGWNTVDYGKVGKNREGKYVVPGYTWVKEHMKGDPALAEIKTHMVKAR